VSTPARITPDFPRRRLDRRAVSVVKRLQDAGYEAYLVGGCVRDLLLGQRPKDFDIATSARPEKVRRLFRRSQIIGRRFKIVHVYMGREIYECATFRGAPPESGDTPAEAVQVIRDDNVYGSAAEDAFRRDFTVNGLFLDPVAFEIVDWVGGMADIKGRTLRSIGDPKVRFREDPVRVLRLVKFLRRLGLEPANAEVAAARDAAPMLQQAATARIAEELFRLMSTGEMEGVFLDLEGLGLLRVVMPEVDIWLQRGGDRREKLLARFRALDDTLAELKAARHDTPGYGFLLAILFGPMVEEEFDPKQRTVDTKEYAQVVAEVLGRFQARARLPRVAMAHASRYLLAQLRMDPPDFVRKPRSPEQEAPRTIEQDWFPGALEYLRCRLEAEGRDLSLFDQWHELSVEAGADEARR